DRGKSCCRQRQSDRAAVARYRVPGLQGAALLRGRGKRSGPRRSGAASAAAHRARRSPSVELRGRRRDRVSVRDRMTAAPITAPVRAPLDPVAWLALPAVAYLLFVYALPLLLLLAHGVMGPQGLTIAPLASFLGDPFNWQVIANTLRVAGLVTVVCLVIGYPT